MLNARIHISGGLFVLFCGNFAGNKRFFVLVHKNKIMAVSCTIFPEARVAHIMLRYADCKINHKCVINLSIKRLAFPQSA